MGFVVETSLGGLPVIKLDGSYSGLFETVADLASTSQGPISIFPPDEIGSDYWAIHSSIGLENDKKGQEIEPEVFFIRQIQDWNNPVEIRDFIDGHRMVVERLLLYNQRLSGAMEVDRHFVVGQINNIFAHWEDLNPGNQGSLILESYIAIRTLTEQVQELINLEISVGRLVGYMQQMVANVHKDHNISLGDILHSMAFQDLHLKEAKLPPDINTIILELCQNQIKYGGNGSASFTISRTPLEERRNLSVGAIDSGIGVDEASFPNIFKGDGSRAEIAKSHTENGSGRGLGNILKTVERYHGSFSMLTTDKDGGKILVRLKNGNIYSFEMIDDGSSGGVISVKDIAYWDRDGGQYQSLSPNESCRDIDLIRKLIRQTPRNPSNGERRITNILLEIPLDNLGISREQSLALTLERILEKREKREP